MPSTTAPATRPPPARSSRLATTGLLVLCLLPALAGTVRLVELASGAAITPDNARFFESPVPVVLHVVSVVVCTVVGADGLGAPRRPGAMLLGRRATGPHPSAPAYEAGPVGLGG